MEKTYCRLRNCLFLDYHRSALIYLFYSPQTDYSNYALLYLSVTHFLKHSSFYMHLLIFAFDVHLRLYLTTKAKLIPYFVCINHNKLIIQPVVALYKLYYFDLPITKGECILFIVSITI